MPDEGDVYTEHDYGRKVGEKRLKEKAKAVEARSKLGAGDAQRDPEKGERLVLFVEYLQDFMTGTDVWFNFDDMTFNIGDNKVFIGPEDKVQTLVTESGGIKMVRHFVIRGAL